MASSTEVPETEFESNMPSSPIDRSAIDYRHSRVTTSSWHCRRLKIMHSAIIITAAYLLDMSDAEPPAKRKNAKWDEDVEVFQMMEYLKGTASKAGEGGNFPDTFYHQAAQHILPFKPPNTDPKTSTQVEGKYQAVCFHTHLQSSAPEP